MIRSFLVVVLLSLLVGGCAGGRYVTRYQDFDPTAPVVTGGQTPAAPEAVAGTTQPDKGTVAVKRDGTKRTVGTVTPKPTGQDIRRADSEGNEQASLLLRKDDEEDDISALLTPEYLRQFDIPIVFNDAVQYFVRYFSTEKRKIFAGWLKRSRRYVPMIKEILREHGLPEDLIYLAMIESGFNPKAYSPAKACGPWQFIYDTGGRYGLRVNHWVDERRDPEKSTVAAALYLKDLFNQFGCWYLAAAGYNAGEKRIEKAIEKHETDNFWELRKYNTLPKETKEYIPRLLAAAIIAKDPEKFGFTNINYDLPIKFVQEKVPGGVPLTVVAKAASSDVFTLRGLNPELLTGITPPDVDTYMMKLPESMKRDRFKEELAGALDKERKVEQAVAYTLKKRESLATLLKRHRLTRSDLLLVNSCDEDLRLRPGKVVYIPRFSHSEETGEIAQETTRETVQEAPARKEASRKETGRRLVVLKKTKGKGRVVKVMVAAKETPRSFHVVKKGESLAGISERYGIDLETLKEINSLKKDQVYPNMRLALTSHTESIDEKPAKGRGGVFRKAKKGKKLTTIAEKEDTDELPAPKQVSRPKKGKVRAAAKLKSSPKKAKRAARG